MMSGNISLARLTGSMIIMLLMMPVNAGAQKHEREQVLMDDIIRLGERAVRDHVISSEENVELLDFIRDSLPEGKRLRVRTLEKLRNELDDQYAEAVRRSQQILEEAVGRGMLPGLLHEPEGYVSPEEKRRQNENMAVANSAIDMKELMKYVKPLPMKPWLMTTLRMLFGNGVSQRPARWDQIVVPQMGRVYDIILPGGAPDYSWMNAPEMEYDPHPDKHFRR